MSNAVAEEMWRFEVRRDRLLKDVKLTGRPSSTWGESPVLNSLDPEIALDGGMVCCASELFTCRGRAAKRGEDWRQCQDAVPQLSRMPLFPTRVGRRGRILQAIAWRRRDGGS
jgi:hypothetical protein